MRIRRSLLLAVATALLCAGVPAAFAQETIPLVRGKQYKLDSVFVCMTEDAAKELVNSRGRDDFGHIPTDCKIHNNIPAFVERKLPLKGPSQILHHHSGGKETCYNKLTQEYSACDYHLLVFAIYVVTVVLDGARVRAFAYMNDKYIVVEP